MSGSNNPWDSLSDSFNTHKDDIDPGAADNILIAWPALFEGISRTQPSGNGLNAFDLGCGTGSFAAALHQRGYHVSAADPASKMIGIAQTHLGQHIAFHVADAAIAATLSDAPFALITSVMALQFISGIDDTLEALDSALQPNGLFAFAVFNPEFVSSNTGNAGYFEHKDGQLCMMADGLHIPVYTRDENDYDKRLCKLGYNRFFLKKPEFTSEFLERYPQSMNTQFSEYLILVYQKENSGFRS